MIFMLFIPWIILINSHIKTSAPWTFWTILLCPDKAAAVDESVDAGAEMTEEEWNLRVAELNKHQVCICNLKSPVYNTKYNVTNHTSVNINQNQKFIQECLYRTR